MATIYERMQGRASALLKKYAQGMVILTRTTVTDPDPATPWIPGEPTPVDYPLDATVSGVSAEFVDGSAILATDLQITCAVPPVVPLLSDTITIDGEPVSVIQVLPIPAAGTPVAYRLVVRG